ncbi:hypothetical protein WME79_23000 [Sorangium sp. So ce726]|uniref:hypothetical protein n=1 Tax=Sorangium sp. So ce726 TaxID=3133319 RepID=UPI003F617BA8
MEKPDLSAKTPEELITLFSDPAARVFATHRMAEMGAPALVAIRSVLDGSAVNRFGHSYRSFGEVYRCALISAGLMGAQAISLEPLLRDAARHSTEILSAEAIHALRRIGWNDDETVSVLAGALDRDVDTAAEAVIAIEHAGKADHPVVANQLSSSPRAREMMARFGRKIAHV